MEDQPKINEKIVFAGKVGEVVHIEQDDGRVFEQYRRSPGTRLIIISPDGKILITKEHRHETNSVDLRLPGGKVCDSLDDFNKLRNSGQDMLEVAKTGAKKEALEETGLHVKDLEFITKANAGATVDWNLYYFLVRDYAEDPTGQKLEVGEQIEVTWMSPAQIQEAIARGQMQEWRSVGVLLGKVLPVLETL